MYSQTVFYALRAVVFLATQSPVPATTSVIATETRVPRAYMAKVLQALRRANVVYTRRGVGGGVGLVKRPEELSMIEVVNAVDPVQRICECPLGLESHRNQLCGLHKRLDNAFAAIEEVFRSTTLAEILADSPDVCPMPLRDLVGNSNGDPSGE